MDTAIYTGKYLDLELDKLGVVLNKTEHKPEKFKTKVEAVINIPSKFKGDKDFIRNKARVYAEQISKKILEVNYMAVEENSIKDSDDIVIKVLILE